MRLRLPNSHALHLTSPPFHRARPLHPLPAQARPSCRQAHGWHYCGREVDDNWTRVDTRGFVSGEIRSEWKELLTTVGFFILCWYLQDVHGWA